MKIVTDEKVYVQKNDIAYLNQTDLAIPVSIYMKVFGNGVVIIDDRNRYEFLEFTAPKEIEFFKSIDWMIDYNEVKDLTEEELISLGSKMAYKANKIANKYNSMSQTKRKENRHLMVEHELLSFKMHSLKDIILFKRGELNIELPKDILKPTIDSQTPHRANNGLKLIRSLFTKRKRK